MTLNIKFITTLIMLGFVSCVMTACDDSNRKMIKEMAIKEVEVIRTKFDNSESSEEDIKNYKNIVSTIESYDCKTEQSSFDLGLAMVLGYSNNALKRYITSDNNYHKTAAACIIMSYNSVNTGLEKYQTKSEKDNFINGRYFLIKTVTYQLITDQYKDFVCPGTGAAGPIEDIIEGYITLLLSNVGNYFRTNEIASKENMIEIRSKHLSLLSNRGASQDYIDYTKKRWERLLPNDQTREYEIPAPALPANAPLAQ